MDLELKLFFAKELEIGTKIEIEILKPKWN